jgi:two-component system OmpR family response regulator
MPRTILVADDEPGIRSWLTRLLEDAGYRVIAAGSVEEAKKALAGGGPELIITDVRMGAFNGLQLVAMNPTIPAIVMTGHDDPVIEADARQLGADFILKPLDSPTLVRMVAKRLGAA